MESIYDKPKAENFIARLDKLNAATEAKWGKMNTSQMMAHCSKAFKAALAEHGKRPNFLKRFALKTFVKQAVVNEKPYRKNLPTPSNFKVEESKDFNTEKEKLESLIKEIQYKGQSFFDNKEHPSFGKLTSKEWSNLLTKHMEHHLKQFDV